MTENIILNIIHVYCGKNGKIHGWALLWQIYDQEKNVLVLACTYQENSKILL